MSIISFDPRLGLTKERKTERQTDRDKETGRDKETERDKDRESTSTSNQTSPDLLTNSRNSPNPEQILL